MGNCFIMNSIVLERYSEFRSSILDGTLDDTSKQYGDQEESILMMAMWMADFAVVECLLNAGLNPLDSNSQGHNGLTYWDLSNPTKLEGYIQIASLLVKKGYDLKDDYPGVWGYELYGPLTAARKHDVDDLVSHIEAIDM
jgi:hypothetical protein